MYRTTVFLHILAGATWVGASVLILGALQSTLNRLGPEATADLHDRFGWADKFIFVPAPLIVLLTGVGMVIAGDAWDFSQPWVYLTLALFVVSAVLGGGFLSRMAKQLGTARAEGRQSTPEFLALMRQYISMASLDVAILFLFVFLMVFKPGV